MLFLRLFSVIILTFWIAPLKAQAPFIDPTGIYLLHKNPQTDSLNVYTRIDIKWISGERIALRLYINTKYGVVLRPMSFIDEDNIIVFRTADQFPGCNTTFTITTDTLKVTDIKPVGDKPCVSKGDMWGTGIYYRVSRLTPPIGGILDAR